MKLAYADPPYPGQARKHYKDDPSGIVAAEVNHAWLIGELERNYPDGWALSTSSSALKEVLALCPGDVRVGAWVKPFASFKPGVNPAYAWEPVIWRGGRRKRSRDEPTVRDPIAHNITLKRGTHGAKPFEFMYWLFLILGMEPGDELDDLFPGSGTLTKAQQQWRNRLWTAA